MVPYIIKALQKSESVCVNDLGTFSLHYVPARIASKEILPPHNEVTLDTNIDHDEIAFTNLVAMEKRCLLTKANQEIIQWVEELKNALENNKSITYDDFGTFSLNDKGKISFVCDHIPALNEEFEGMETLTPGIAVNPEIIEESEEPVIEPAVTPFVVPESVVEAEPEEEPVIQRSTLLEEEAAVPVVEPEPVVEAEPEEEPVIQRSTLLEEEAAEPAVEPEPVVEAKPEEEPVIQRSTLLKEEAAEPVVEPEPVVEAEPEEEPVIQRSTLLEEEAAEPVVEPEPVVEAEPKEPVQQADETTEENADTENDEDDDDYDDDETEEVVRRKSHWWIWLLIILLLAAIGVCGYLFRDKLTPLYEQIKGKFSKTEEVVEPEKEDETTTDYQEVVEEPQTVEEEPAPYTPEVIKSSTDGKYEYIRFESGHFYVIAGSLPNEKDAELHIRQRALDKYEPRLLLQDGVSNIRVCIGIFDTEEEAENYAKGISPKYWVLK